MQIRCRTRPALPHHGGGRILPPIHSPTSPARAPNIRGWRAGSWAMWSPITRRCATCSARNTACACSTTRSSRSWTPIGHALGQFPGSATCSSMAGDGAQAHPRRARRHPSPRARPMPQPPDLMRARHRPGCSTNGLPQGRVRFRGVRHRIFPITVMCRLIGASPDVIPGLRSAMEAIGLSTSMDPRWLPAMQQGVDHHGDLRRRPHRRTPGQSQACGRASPTCSTC
jgi:hypothetical protein